MTKATRIAYGEALSELGENYDFLVLDGDLSKATQTCLFARKFPDRFFNIGIAEQDLMEPRRDWQAAEKPSSLPPLRCLRPVGLMNKSAMRLLIPI